MKKNIKSIVYSILAASLIISSCGTDPTKTPLILNSENLDSQSYSADSIFNESGLIEASKNTRKSTGSTPGNSNFNLESTNETSSVESFVVASFRRVFNEYEKIKVR